MSILTTVQYLISTYGRDMTLRYAMDTNLDLSNPSGPNTANTVETTIKGYTTNYNKDEITGSLIKSDDLKCFIGQLDKPITTDDKVIIGSDVYNIKAVSPSYDKEAVVMHEITLRK